MSTQASSSGSLVRWVLPVGIFVLIVGAIAWVSQNLSKAPAPKDPTGDKNVFPVDREPDLKFPVIRARWDVDSNAVKEYEQGVEGYYDFPFVNPNAHPITLGFAQTNCDCTQLKVALLGQGVEARIDEWQKDMAAFDGKSVAPFPVFPVDEKATWTQLEQSDKHGLDIPAKSGGVTRIFWKGRKAPPSQLRLGIKLWMQPVQKPDDRSFVMLDVPIVMAEPLSFYPDRLSLGTLGAGGTVAGETVAWSATRRAIKIVPDPKADPLLEATVTPLDAAGIKEFEATLRENKAYAGAHVLSAYKVHVTLREQKNGKQIEQGPFQRELPLLVEDLVDFHTATVTAYIRGDVDVGSPEDGGKIMLKTFSAKDGLRRTIPLYTESPDELTIESVRPAVIEVKLTKNVKESSATRKKWMLDITIPPGAWQGDFRDDAVVIIRSGAANGGGAGTPPKRIRIPIVGNAASAGGQG